MNPLVTVLLSAGGASIIAAMINAVMNRRKLSAEATEIITKAAAGTVANVVTDNTALRERVAALEEKMQRLTETARLHEQRERAWQAHEERYRWHLERWSRYANTLLVMLSQRGVVIAEEQPPLYPDLHP